MPDVMMEQMRKTNAVRDIVLCDVPNVKFAVRVRVFEYPENVVACWVMIAACYMNV